MLFKTTKSQTLFLLKQKEAILVFYLLLIMVLINFMNNVITFQGKDIIRMYQPMKLLLLSYNRVNYNADATLLFIQLYPLLVVCPAGFSLAKDHHSGFDTLIVARLGYTSYIFSKLLAVFFTTFIVFSVPFIIEIMLNCLSFPLTATGDLTNWHTYNPSYIQGVRNYLLNELYILNPYLYAIIGTLFSGFVSGLFGAFTVAFSSVVQVKYRVFLFLPIFLILNATVYLSELLSKGTSTIKWYDYLLLFNDRPKNLFYLVIGIFALICFSLYAIYRSSRKGCL